MFYKIDGDSIISANKVDAPGFSLTPETYTEPVDGWHQFASLDEAMAFFSKPAGLTASPWQIRKALNQMGLRDTVEQAVAASTDQALKDGWEYATEFRRLDPFVVSFIAMLGMTDAQGDDFFRLAGSL